MLIIPYNEEMITKPERFGGVDQIWQMECCFITGNAKIDYPNMPTNEEKEQGYFPRLQLSRTAYPIKGSFMNLYIECSLPKLLYGNNFEEVTQEHFDTIIQVLQDALFSMAVEVGLEVLMNAKVVRIHYSKNLIITEHSTCREILQVFAKSDIPKRLDVSRTTYKNDGEIIRYHASSYELTFYDKLKDLQTAINLSEKRTLERQNIIQSDFLERARGMEVLRMEFRINDMNKLKDDVFPKMEIEYPEPTFRNLFKKELSRRTFLHFWNIAQTAARCVILAQSASVTVFQNILHLGYKPEKAAAIAQAFHLLSNGFSMRDLKNMSTPWHKLVQEASGQMNLERSYLHRAFLNIGRLLDSFEPLSFSSFNL